MAKRKRLINSSWIERKLKEGRGKGHFSEYKPWLTIHDVPSKGVVTRVLGWKSGRLHHFLSEHYELAHFFQMEWATNVLDIREQFPLLPIEKTMFIAEKLGVKHPTHPKTHQSVVMTTDMLLTVKRGDEIHFQAHSIKPKSKISKRVLEKLEIERRFFEDEGISWRLVTERQIDRILVENVKWVHSAKTLLGMPHLNTDLVDGIEPYLYEALQEKTKPCTDITMCFDESSDLPPGTSMYILRYLVANRRWEIDMKSVLTPSLTPVRVVRKILE
ncbi:TnsA endonuclease N-terminal domain-containing protein [Ammoniphilus sp. CFH 90114]|uniref:TnsA endonuclease N-terminal domain-containing protein n=1 Tax=Ammoniphilus sp. CFH 90114 TaxID=2493665 RepID=UPI00100F7539|nr:TnsA endonuclease N-terminal domain-containing protein [Ammoniphilus sp. CFH 90114]RXT05277.1 heteromeric transposase endonuclease subunit TnsA [Ammoniphilus sp. CFH 90114]